MKENPIPVSSGDTIPFEETELAFTETSAHIFNHWINYGRPLPFVYVKMLDEKGQETLIHVTEIDRIISESKSMKEKADKE